MMERPISSTNEKAAYPVEPHRRDINRTRRRESSAKDVRTCCRCLIGMVPSMRAYDRLI